MLTQRPAVIHKDVLSQAEILIAMRMSSVRDVPAIDDWVSLHAEDEEARTVKASLPSLPIGTAWVWSPGWVSSSDVAPPTCQVLRRSLESAARILAPVELDDVAWL